jgi:hypothetical protein
MWVRRERQGNDVVNRVDVPGFCGYGRLGVNSDPGGDESRAHN